MLYDLNLFRIFQAIFLTQSTSRAAEKLLLSQPSISKGLKKLREEFNDPLFVYVDKKMQPTELAEKVAPTIFEGLRLLERSLQENAPFNPVESDRTFRLSMSDYTEELLLPKLLTCFRENNYSIKIEVEHLRMAKRHEALEEGLTDLNIHGSIEGIHKQKYGTGIMQSYLFSDRYVFLISDHMEGLHSPVSLEVLGDLPHARYGDSKIIDRLLETHGLSRNVVLQVPHLLVLPEIMIGQNMIATFPEKLARRMAKSFPLRILESPIEIPQLKFHMYWHEKNQNSVAHKWLRDTICGVLGI